MDRSPPASTHESGAAIQRWSDRLQSRRPYVASLAVVFALAGLGLQFYSEEERGLAIAGSLLRMAIVLGCLWMAIPVLATLDWRRSWTRWGALAASSGVLLMVVGRVSPKLTMPLIASGIVVSWLNSRGGLDRSKEPRPER